MKFLIGLALPLVLLGGLYAATMPPTITWWHGGSDSGDLASAAAEPGVPHPTGYPLFVLLGYSATRLPFAEPAGRINALNVSLMLAALAMVMATAARLAAAATRPVWLLAAAGVAGVAVGSSGLVWSQAIIAEVYALHAALVAGCFWAWTRPLHPAARGVLHGLALANHLTALIVLVAAAVALLKVRTRPDRNAIVAFAGGLLAPLLLYLLLPVWSAAGADANWGNPVTPAGLWRHATGGQYQGRLQPFALAATANDALRLVRFAAGDLAPWLLPAAAAGWWQLRQRSRFAAWLLALTAAGTLVFTASYRAEDRAPYLLPLYLCVGVCAVPGLVTLARSVAAHGRLPRLTGAVLLLFSTGLWMVRQYPEVNLRGDDSALVFARATLEALPPGATYYTARDDVTFALWYAQRTRGIRRDVQVIDLRNPAQRGVR